MKTMNNIKRHLGIISVVLLGIFYLYSMTYFLDGGRNFRYYLTIEAEYGIGNLALALLLPIIIITLLVGKKNALTPLLIGGLGVFKILSAFLIVPLDEVFSYFTHMPTYYDLFFGNLAVGAGCIITMIIMFGKISPKAKGINPSLIVGIIGVANALFYYIVCRIFIKSDQPLSGGAVIYILVYLAFFLGLMFAGYAYSNKKEKMENVSTAVKDTTQAVVSTVQNVTNKVKEAVNK